MPAEQPAKPSTSASTPRPAASPIDRAVDCAIAVGVSALILIGFAASYRTLRDLAADVGGYPPWLAPVVPLSFDLGIVVLSLKVIRLARDGRSAPILRVLVAVLSVCTVAANAAGADGMIPKLLHVVPPAMFVVCFESVVITARRNALERLGRQPTPIPRMRTARWLLSPLPTWRMWRAAVLADDQYTRSGRTVPMGSLALLAQPGRQITASAGPGPTRAKGVDSPRLEVAVAALREAPDMTAVQLTDKLAEAGHRVSVRTAQRIRASVAPSRAQSERGAGGGSGNP